MMKRLTSRITREEALALFSRDIHALAEEATSVKGAVVEDRADYGCFIIDRNINFTNICSARCNFCAFYRDKDDPEAFTLSVDEILEKVDHLVQLGGTQVMLQGGLHEKFGLSFYKSMLVAIKRRYPSLYIHSLSPAEISYLAQIESRSVSDIISELKEAGLQSLPGAAEILVDEHRRRVNEALAGYGNLRLGVATAGTASPIDNPPRARLLGAALAGGSPGTLLALADVRQIVSPFPAAIPGVEPVASAGGVRRYELGGAVGPRLVNTNRAQMLVGGGVVFNQERDVDTEPTQNIEGLLTYQSSYFTYDPPTTNLDVSFQYYPGLSDWGRQRLQFDASAKREVFKDFFVALDLFDTYDSRPSEGQR